MRKCFFILAIASMCSAKGFFIETDLENHFPPKYYGNYDVILQEPDVSVKYHFNFGLLAGVGLGPLAMGGFDPTNDSLKATTLAYATNVWVDLNYALKLPFAHSLLCFGGRFGNILDHYYLVYDTNNTESSLIKFYEVKDTYFAAIGPKFIIGFKYIRFAADFLINFGNRKEIWSPDEYDYYMGAFKGEKKSSIVSYQIDVGIIAVIGKD